MKLEDQYFKIGFRFTVLYSQFAVAVSRAAIEWRGPTVTENWEQWNCGRKSVRKQMIRIHRAVSKAQNFSCMANTLT
jgi:hypothetical protein